MRCLECESPTVGKVDQSSAKLQLSVTFDGDARCSSHADDGYLGTFVAVLVTLRILETTGS